MKISPVIIQYHLQNRYYEIFNTENLAVKKRHIENVIEQGLAIAKLQNAPVDMNFLFICLEHHDDGRIDQMRLFGRFLDTEISHNVLGINRFEKFILNQSDVQIDESIDVLRNVILYHGRENLMSAFVTEKTKLYVRIVTEADDFENAFSCISYLEKEVKNDEKCYIKANPEANQKEVSSYVFEHFRQGKKFDKIKYCHTYAEYVIFAATLAMNCILKYGNIAKTVLKQQGYGYDSILDGFKDIFEKTLTSEMAKEAYKILVETIE